MLKSLQEMSEALGKAFDKEILYGKKSTTWWPIGSTVKFRVPEYDFTVVGEIVSDFEPGLYEVEDGFGDLHLIRGEDLKNYWDVEPVTWTLPDDPFGTTRYLPAEVQFPRQ